MRAQALRNNNKSIRFIGASVGCVSGGRRAISCEWRNSYRQWLRDQSSRTSAIHSPIQAVHGKIVAIGWAAAYAEVAYASMDRQGTFRDASLCCPLPGARCRGGRFLLEQDSL